MYVFAGNHNGRYLSDLHVRRLNLMLNDPLEFRVEINSCSAVMVKNFIKDLTIYIMQVLDMSSWTWSKINAKSISESSISSDSLAPCAGHSLVSETKFLTTFSKE